MVLQEIWSKVNPRERIAVIGAGLIVLSWILGLFLSGGLYGFASAGGVGLLGALALLVVVYLRYAPNSNVTWPAPYPVILLGISAVVGLIALLNLLQLIGILGLLASYGGISVVLVLVLDWVGAGLMVWGSYQEWQLSKTAA